MQVNRREFGSAALGALGLGTIAPETNTVEVATTHDLKQAVNNYWGFSHKDRPVPKHEDALHVQLHDATRASNDDNDYSTPSPKTQPIKFLAQRIDHDVSSVMSSLSDVAFPEVNPSWGEWRKYSKNIPVEARRAYEVIAAPLATAINDYTKNVTEWVKTFAA